MEDHDYNGLLKQLKTHLLSIQLAALGSVRDSLIHGVAAFWNEHYDINPEDLTPPESDFITYLEAELLLVRRRFVALEAKYAAAAVDSNGMGSIFDTDEEE